MSQIQNFGMGGIPPAGPVLTLTGDDAIPVSPIAGTIFVEGEFNSSTIGFASTEGHPVQNTLAIVPLHASVTTNDGAFNLLYTLTFATNDTAAVLFANVIGVSDDFSNVCAGTVTCGGRKPGAGNVQSSGTSGGVTTDYIGNPAPNAIIISSGSTLQLRVRGVAGQTWNWTAQIIYQFVI